MVAGACVRRLTGRSGPTPAPPVRPVRPGHPVIAWGYALSVAFATQGRLCLSPLTDAERLMLFPEVLLPEKPVTHDRLPYHGCGHCPEKRAVAARQYRRDEAARAAMAVVTASPDRLRGAVRRWQHRVSPDDLADMLARWQERQPGLADIRAARWATRSTGTLPEICRRVA